MTGTWAVSGASLVIMVANIVSSFALSEWASMQRQAGRRRLLHAIAIICGIPGGVILYHLAVYGMAR